MTESLAFDPRERMLVRSKTATVAWWSLLLWSIGAVGSSAAISLWPR